MKVRELANGVFGVAVENELANCAGFVVGDGKALVVDTLMIPADSIALRDAVASHAPSGAIAVVNTHCHGDHVFGNMLFAGSNIIAHSAARDRLAEAAAAGLVERFSKLLPQYAADVRRVEVVLPNLCYCRSLSLYLGDKRVELFPDPATAMGTRWSTCLENVCSLSATCFSQSACPPLCRKAIRVAG